MSVFLDSLFLCELLKLLLEDMNAFSGCLRSCVFVFDAEDVREVQVMLHGSTGCRQLNAPITAVLFYS